MSNTTAVRSQERRATAVRSLAVLASLLLVSLLVITNSRAAFTGTTDVSGEWSTADVTLSDNTTEGVLFNVDGMVPGDVVSEDVTVTYDGTAQSVDVRLYGEALSDADSLAQYLNLTVAVGETEVFTGTLDTFVTAHGDFANSADTWDDASPNDTRTYSFTVELDAGTPDSAENQTASVSFVWEAQSNPTPTP